MGCCLPSARTPESDGDTTSRPRRCGSPPNLKKPREERHLARVRLILLDRTESRGAPMSKAGWLTAGASVAVVWAAASAQENPRTSWGDPDLRGTYTSDNSIGVPFERPTQFGERAELTDEEYAAKVSANEEQ